MVLNFKDWLVCVSEFGAGVFQLNAWLGMDLSHGLTHLRQYV